MISTSAAAEKIIHLPNHIAIVPDGNGRWAQQRGLPRLEGHRVGARNLRDISEYLDDYKIKYISIYLFSTENWNRPQAEIEGLFRLSAQVISQNASRFHKRDIRLRHIGRLAQLPSTLQQAINKGVELTKNNAGTTLNLAFNYGGRAEIIDAVHHIILDGAPLKNINEELFSNYLYSAGLPDVDLLIRTADERRLSNFLIWQTAYSEYYFTNILWPDFSKKQIDEALLSYNLRHRRFGGL
ncbi:polyprenyl diphosphate synthase [Chloroflexota bacterium]